jgi:hypothetical protein
MNLLLGLAWVSRTYFQCLRIATFVASDLGGDGDVLVTPGARVCKLHDVADSAIFRLNQWDNGSFLPVQKLLTVVRGHNECRNSKRLSLVPSATTTPAQLELLIGTLVACSLETFNQPITKSDVECYGHRLENYQRAAVCGKQPLQILMEQEPLPLRERERESFVQGLIRKPAYRLKLIMYLNMSKLFFCNVSAAAGVHKNRRGCAICTSAAYSSFSCSWRSRTWHCKTLKSPSTLFGNHQFDTDPL